MNAKKQIQNDAQTLKTAILEDLNDLFYRVPIEEREKIEAAIFQLEELKGE